MTKLSIIMPVYNEKGTINEILKRVNAVPLKKEIIIIDDFSTDGTREILRENHSKKRDVTVLFHEKNKGKGAAIRTGLEAITGDIIIIQDADLEYNPQDYTKLIQPIINKETEVVYGSRFLDKKNRHKYGLNMFATKLLTFLANILYNAKITDEPTCYKVFSSNAIKSINLKCKKFEFCPEVTAKIKKAGFKIKEVPIEYNARSIEEGKKINWKDGVQAIWTLLKYRFVN
tara:strand:+ start:3157 stop:3846 length:690 start_codon:yes stop_codon:yes gene_type:complete